MILHSDMNNFYASVEILYDPTLRDKPVAVAGDEEARHGIVLAKNDIAKRFGIRTGQVLWEARQQCPGLVCVPAHYERYLAFSAQARDIYTSYTDQVESFGLDECWLDVTGSVGLFGEGPAIADEIRGRMKRELGLTVSVGVSFNKVFAKLGSDMKKPDATTVISPGNWRDLVWPLPVGDLLYVGAAARDILRQYGVENIGQLAACRPEMLEDLMGKMGVQLYEYANGLDQDPVRARCQEEAVKSVGNGTTFPQNLTTEQQVRRGVSVLADSVASRLRRHGLYAGGVQLTVRDPQFRDRSRQRQFSAPTHLIRDLTEAAMALAREIWRPPDPIRALTVTAIHLVREGEAYEQVDLFNAAAAPKKERQEKLEAAMVKIRGKYGAGAISYGSAAPEREPDPLP